MGPEAVEAVPAIIDLLDHENQQVREKAAYALSRIGPDVEEVVPALIAELVKEEYRFVSSFEDSLGNIGEASVMPLIELLPGSSNIVKGRALRALGGVGPDAIAAVGAITTELENPELEVRHDALFALTKIGYAEQDSAPVLIEILSRREPETCALAAKVLGYLVYEERIVDALIRALDYELPRAREYSARSLGNFGVYAVNALPKLRYLAENDPYIAPVKKIYVIRVAAQEAIEKIEAAQ